jgi:myo-inositol 2-dehydrogenase/D-chiro-inositol 1-dehydrogenase
MSDLRVAVIGTGVMGADHVERLTRRTKGATVSVVYDFDQARAAAVAESAGCRVAGDAIEAIRADDVDAVLIVSPGAFHAEQALACFEVGKPVLCEKPLAVTAADAYRVVLAEAALPKPLLTLGFMRRYDPEYAALVASLRAGDLGEPILINCKHRNATSGGNGSDRAVVFDSAVHEVDVARFVLGEEIAGVRVILPKPGPNRSNDIHDPMLFLFTMASGRLVTDEMYVNTNAGYEVRTEVLASKGIATIGLEVGRMVSHTPGLTWGGTHVADFRPRFATAYDIEVQAWVDAVRRGDNVDALAATSWDGYAAAAVCEAAVVALDAGGAEVPVTLLPRPA